MMRLLGLGLAVVVIAGCTSKEAPTPVAKINGSITIDMRPVPTGELHFVMPGIPPRVMQITNGAFSGDAPVGENKVEVFIYVEGPPSEKYGGERTKINSVPERYWGPNTSLMANVTASGPNEFQFNITAR